MPDPTKPVKISDVNEFNRREQAYSDSADLYNNYQNLISKLKKNDYEPIGHDEYAFPLSEKDLINTIESGEIHDSRPWFDRKFQSFTPEKLQLKKRGNLYETLDFYPGIINEDLGTQFFSSEIQPESKDNWRKGRFGDGRLVYNYSNVKPTQPVEYAPEQEYNIPNSIEPSYNDSLNDIPITPKRASYQQIPTKQATVLPTELVNERLLSTVPVENTITYPKGVSKFTAGKQLEILGKPTREINQGDNTGWKKTYGDGGVKDKKDLSFTGKGDNKLYMGRMLPEATAEDELPLTNKAYLGKLKKENPIAYGATSAQNEAGDAIMGAAEMTDVGDALVLGKALSEGDWGTIGLAAGATALPLVGYGAFKQGKKLWNKAKTPKNFKSEINWSNWNKEIPENEALMKEYNSIEHQTKANGTWMKNADGSEFKGTPEQFVQQNSENFKNAYPDGNEVVYRGVSGHFPEQKTGELFTGTRGMAEGYGGTDIITKDTPLGYGKGTHELYKKLSNNQIDVSLPGQDWADLDLFNTEKFVTRMPDSKNNIGFLEKQLNKLELDIAKVKKGETITDSFTGAEVPLNTLEDSFKS